METATLVQKIHAEVGQASAVLLQDAPYNSYNANFLTQLGFSSAENVQDYTDHKEHHGEAIYYSQKYPLYKFITEHQLGKIRTKYNLMTDQLSRFKGNIPEKNVEELMQFNIKRNDIETDQYRHLSDITDRWAIETGRGVQSIYERLYMNSPSTEVRINRDVRRPLTGPNFYTEAFERTAEKMHAARREEKTQARNMHLNEIANEFPRACSITADRALFNAPDRDLDPIVTVAVKGGYLVVTAWGAEACDPDVVNQKMN